MAGAGKTNAAEKLSLTLWTVIKEPEKQQGSQRNLNL